MSYSRILEPLQLYPGAILTHIKPSVPLYPVPSVSLGDCAQKSWEVTPFWTELGLAGPTIPQLMPPPVLHVAYTAGGGRAGLWYLDLSK